MRLCFNTTLYSPLCEALAFDPVISELALTLAGVRMFVSVEEFARRAHGASCADVYAWHKSRFEGREMPDNWARHIEMFAPGGRYAQVEKELLKLGDLDGDGKVDWQEFVAFMGERFDADGSLKASATLARKQ